MKFPAYKLWALTLTLFISGVVFAQEKVQQDLIGEKGANSEMALKNRGFTHIKTEKSGYNIYSYWWNEGAKSCICERIADGRVQSIVKSTAWDCNKTDSGNRVTHQSYEHTSSDHENNRHYNNAGQEGAFEKGYLDGLHHKAYSNPYPANATNKIEAYAWGYTAGDKKRTEKTSHHTGNAGYHNTSNKEFVEYHDLIGHEARPVYVQLEQRGFAEQHTKEYNGYVHRIYHNRDTGQCIETLERNEYITDIRHYDNCNQFMK